jgi:hypothetical protein
MEPSTPAKQATEPKAPIKEALVNKFPKKNYKTILTYAVVALVVVAAGIGSGWFLSGRNSTSGSPSGNAAPGATSSQNEAGIADESTFSDTATGILQEGGISGEGTHHLVREGGESKYVYLTSTVIDLESFVGKNVQVWGQTVTAQKAGWLMDVGKIKVLQ